MAPSKKSTIDDNASSDNASLADILRMLKSQADKLSSIDIKLNKVDVIESEVKDLKTLIVSLRDENKELRSEIKLKDTQLTEMQATVSGVESRLNSLEQHHRGWGARILNIPVSPAEEADPEVMIQKVFDLALRPILEGAVSSGKLKSIPLPEQVLEVAHVLPGKPGLPKPIIVRFFSRNLRNLIFQCKKDFAVREEETRPRRSADNGGGAGGGGNINGGFEGRGRFRFPLYDDLTKMNLSKMRSISQDDRVLACWTINGQIKFRLKDSNEIRKVVCVLDPLEKILG